MVIYLTALATTSMNPFTKLPPSDGAGPVRQFIYVTQCLAVPTMMLIMMLSTIAAFPSSNEIYVLTTRLREAPKVWI